MYWYMKQSSALATKAFAKASMVSQKRSKLRVQAL
jgi:hypothetical protein